MGQAFRAEPREDDVPEWLVVESIAPGALCFVRSKKDRVWFKHFNLESPGHEYAREATKPEVDAALRAESGASVTEVRSDGSAVVTFTINPAFTNPDGWIEKSWGRTRQVFAAEGVEVWESEGKAGHRTSLHCHPGHMQHCMHVTGEVVVVFSSGEEVSSDKDGGFWVAPGDKHELRFKTDCRFVEVYVGTGSVMDTIERIYK